ncbi:MAG: 5-carboxymethyl-2-hydroxymuconate Delta-isomerase [Reichenbachiella sp.]|uniref:5-carboxymethyl-2-hydroxymuconate Delta-isomerase n=1 Tax=Reichenbachiella sp. TaxID=2184521 RepID=UPI0032969102
MPHFIIQCSENITRIHSKQEIMQTVYQQAIASELFVKTDIKVRVQSFDEFIAGEGSDDFIHVFGNIMEGRTAEQKANLSRRIVAALNGLFPQVPIVSMNIRDFEKDSYCNKEMVEQHA